MLAAGAPVVTGCRGGEAAATGPTAAGGGAIVVASAVDIRGVNELTAGSTPLHTAIHYYALFLTLLDEQPDFESGPPTFAPRLADSFELSEDRTVLTFKLRRDVVWSDGVPVTAEDVRWTWQAQTHPEVGWSLADYKRHIADVEVVDAHTVRFHFDEAYATQLLDANLGVVLPRHAWSRLPFSEWRSRSRWFVDNLVVAGPFDLESWEPGQRIVLRRNERYFKPDRPRAERVVFRVVSDRASQLALFESGEAHLIDWARPADAAVLADDPEVTLATFLPRGSRALVWNHRHPLFASRSVRLALTLALDRQAIVDTLYHGYATVTESPFTSNLWVADESLEPRPHDPERAREILAAAGWIDRDGDGVLDRGGQPFRFEILTMAGNELSEDILVMVQSQLARVGVDARQKSVEFNTLVSRERGHDFAATFSSLAVGTDLDLSYFFHSQSIEGGFNISCYSNPEVDRLLDTIKARKDLRAAKPLYDRLQALIYHDVALTILYEPMHPVPIRKPLTNVSPNGLSAFFHLEDWTLGGEG